MTPDEVLGFIDRHGVVLASAKGPVPRVIDAIAKETVKGNWWAHPKGRQIFAALKVVNESETILVCRLINGKVTFVHRRLWPALVRVASRFPPDRIARVREVHTASGHHINRETAFPKWVPAQVKKLAKAMSEEAAFAALGPVAMVDTAKRTRKPRTQPPSRAKPCSGADP